MKNILENKMVKKIDAWKKQLENLTKKVKLKGMNKISKGQRYRLGMLKGLISGYKEGHEEYKKASSSLQKVINRVEKFCNSYRQMNDDRKLQITNYNHLLDKLLKEGRITKLEINKFIKKRKEIVRKK